MIASGLCKAVLRLYSKEFRAEFAADIAASFAAHYREERRRGVGSLRIAAAQYRDIADLLRGALMDRFRQTMIAFHSRKRGMRIYMEEGFDGRMTGYKIVWRVYLAWQAREEAEWLQNMSSQGWEFVDYSWFVYYFRRREEPVEYEYKFERSFLLGWSTRAEEAYLESMREQGWEFIKHFLGWYYFRRPATDKRREAAETNAAEIRKYAKKSRIFVCLGLAALAGLLAVGFGRLSGSYALSEIIRHLIAGACLGIGLAAAVLLAIALISTLKEERNPDRRFSKNVWLLAAALAVAFSAAYFLSKTADAGLFSPHYSESVRVDLSQSARDEETVFRFTLKEPAIWNYRLVVTEMDTPLIDVRLRGKGGEDILLLHGEGFWTNYHALHGSLALDPGQYELVLTNDRSRGRVVLYCREEHRPR